MSLGHLWAFLAVALPVIASILAPLPATDLTYHLRAGEEILALGRIPTHDTWTFTATGLPWFDQQWGAQVVLEVVFRVSGWTGLVLLRATLVGIAFASVLLICRRHRLSWRTAALLTLAAFVVAAPALALRPQLFGMALFGVTLLLVDDRAAHPRRLWLIPLIAMLWANLHGSFFLAPAVLVLVWLRDIATVRGSGRHLPVAVAAVSMGTACLTPFGPAIWTYALSLSSNSDVTARISEWQPATVRDASGLIFFASLALVVAFLAGRGERTPWPTLAWIGFFAFLGLYAARGIAWWPLAAVAALAPMLAPERDPASAPRRQGRLGVANAFVAALLVLAAVALLPMFRPPNAAGAPEGVLSQAPAGLTAELRDLTQQGDRLLNPQRWGSWFEYALPDVPVAIDSRIELFPPSVWADYSSVLAGEASSAEILGRWGVTLIVAEGPEDDPLRRRLAEAGWRLLAEDSDGAILAAPGRAEGGP